MNRLQHFRKKANLTQAQLAAAAGCSQPNIHKIEQGARPGIDLAQRLVDALVSFGVSCTIKEVFQSDPSTEAA